MNWRVGWRTTVAAPTDEWWSTAREAYQAPASFTHHNNAHFHPHDDDNNNNRYIEGPAAAMRLLPLDSMVPLHCPPAVSHHIHSIQFHCMKLDCQKRHSVGGGWRCHRGALQFTPFYTFGWPRSHNTPLKSKASQPAAGGCFVGAKFIAATYILVYYAVFIVLHAYQIRARQTRLYGTWQWMS